MKELEMNSLLVNNLKIQLNLNHLLNLDHQQKKKPGRKAHKWFVRSWIIQREQYGHTTNFCHSSKNMTLVPTAITHGSTMPCSTKYCSKLHFK
ncbi:hypothetical protein E2C01_055751 [Portunus trituberculatus]|uniref:Uncharacterized protein n=1 Tax=Portunus trituberculatus TaxID=210409 RepID=A0A5B7GVL0_PORTR|nr:hypothetical protein [Portunus trituberculatus]